MSWRNRSPSPPENIKEIVQELLHAELISDREKWKMSLLEADARGQVTMIDPHLEMDMRHERAKSISRIKTLRRALSKNEILAEAKRLVTQEDLREKEIHLRNKHYKVELEKFQMDLAKSSINFEKEFVKNESLCNKFLFAYRRVKSSNNIIRQQAKSASINKERNHQEIKKIVDETEIKIEEPDIIKIKDQEITKIPKVENYFEMKIINSQQLEKFEGSRICEKNLIRFPSVSSKFTEEQNSLPLDSNIFKYWRAWRNYVGEQKMKINIIRQKNERLTKIDNFVKSISNKIVKSNEKEKKKNKFEFRSPYITNEKVNIQEANKITKTENCQNSETLEKLVAKQKAKLKEQEKLISKLRLEKIKLANERSAQQTKIYLEGSMTEVSLPMRRKLNYLKSALPQIVDGNNKPRPPFIVQMEERQKERQKRKEEIREKTRQRIVEQQREHVEREFQKKLELAERDRIDRETRLLQIEEEARMRGLAHIAREFCRTRRLKIGFRVFIKALEYREEKKLIAEEHWNERVARNCLTMWWKQTQRANQEREQTAIQHHNRLILRDAWNAWKQVGVIAIQDRQVAEDFHELICAERAFRGWHGLALHRCLILRENVNRAVLHYHRVKNYIAGCTEQSYHDLYRTLIARSFAAWRRLREACEKERKAERKKEALRNCVRLVLPDYRPVLNSSDLLRLTDKKIIF